MPSGEATGASINFAHQARDAQHVSGYSKAILANCMRVAGVQSITITSTYRSPKDQGRVMLDNASRQSGWMYKEHGHAVEKIARDSLSANRRVQDGLAKGFDPQRPLPGPTKSHAETQSEMILKIHELERKFGVGCVSKHQTDPKKTNVIDIDPKSVKPFSALAPFIKALTGAQHVERIGLPGGARKYSKKHFVESVGCLHVEIPQMPAVPDRKIRVDNIA